MRKTFLISKVNFFVSVAFIASFGLFSMSVLFKAVQLEDPIVRIIVGEVDEE